MSSTLETIYRAFADYRKTTGEDNECAMQRSLVARTDAGKDVIETIKHTLIIEEDWVKAIEDGLVFVEKAIAEERQFIRNQGEVVPIEKVRRVSRDSVEHLSKHTDLITTEPQDGEPLIPDELYTVERLSDYAVYENRFLYMLLCYLEQFISIRYDKIVDLANTYRGSLKVNKELLSNRQNLTFKLELKEERRNDPLLAELNPNKSIIERIDMLGKQVAHYKKTPLMLEVKKAPMLRPPITVTNVLRMNHNFRGAMKLYEFVSAYDKAGYSSRREDKRISPFTELAADEFAEVEALASFLTYEYGMSVKDVLRDKYLHEEELRKEAERLRFLEQLKAMKKRVAEQGGDIEQYALMLEKRVRMLEAESLQLVEAKKDIAALEEKIAGLNGTVRQLGTEIDGLNVRDLERLEHIARIEREHGEAIVAMRVQHAQQLEENDKKHADELGRIVSSHEAALSEVERSHNIALEQCLDTISGLNNTIEEIKLGQAAEIIEARRMRDSALEECKQKTAAAAARVNDVENENKLLKDLRTVAEGRLNALRYKHGYIDDKGLDELTSERAFNELEHQYAVFSEFFKKTWKRTKKKIRHAIAEKVKLNEQIGELESDESEKDKTAAGKSSVSDDVFGKNVTKPRSDEKQTGDSD